MPGFNVTENLFERPGVTSSASPTMLESSRTSISLMASAALLVMTKLVGPVASFSAAGLQPSFTRLIVTVLAFPDEPAVSTLLSAASLLLPRSDPQAAKPTAATRPAAMRASVVRVWRAWLGHSTSVSIGTA